MACRSLIRNNLLFSAAFLSVPRVTRNLHTSASYRAGFTNFLAGDTPPPIQVSSVSEDGIQLVDGLVLPSACILLEGNVFLWDVPTGFWNGWSKDHLELFEIVVPRPEILLLGTGRSVSLPPPWLRNHVNQLGIQLDFMDTKNASSTYNLLAEEGRRVAAALLPLTPKVWERNVTSR